MKGFVSRRKPALKAVQAKRASMALRRRDAHERQADDAARRFVAGEVGLSRFLTPAPTAGFSLPSSPGEPLATGIRTELEHAFGADLSAVRIHRDESAAWAASALRSRAFTSGAHLYFAAGKYSPASGDGRRLLAHEVSHAVQQASVRGSDDRMRTYAAMGEAPVQLADGNESPLEQGKVIPADLDFHTLARLYLSLYPNNGILRATVSEVEDELRGCDTKDQEELFWAGLDRKVTQTQVGGDAPEQQQALCLVVDCLKWRGYYTAAAAVADKLTTNRTARFDIRIYPALMERDLGWIGAIWSNHPFFKPYRPKRFVETFYEYLFGTTRGIQDLGKQGNFKRAADDFIASRNSPRGDNPLVEAEPVYYVAWALREADAYRVAHMAGVAAAVAPGIPAARLSPLQRVLVAQRILEWAENLAVGKGIEATPLPVKRLFIELARAIQVAAESALRYWNAVSSVWTTLLFGPSTEEGGDVLVIMAREARKPEYHAFHAALFPPLRDLLMLDSDGWPLSAPVYEKCRRTAIAAIRDNAVRSFEGRLLGALRQAADAKPDRDQLVAYGVMLNIAALLVETLNDYDVGADQAFGEKYRYGSIPAPDLRIRHRLRLARFLWNLGRILQWEDLESLSREVIAARQAGQRSSFLALLDDWREDEDAPLSRLLDDIIPDAELSGWEPLRARDLYRFFQAEYYLRLNKALERKLGESYDVSSLPLVKAANVEVLEDLPRPTRFFIPGSSVERAIQSEDRQRYGDIILAHPKTKELVRKQQTLQSQPVMPLTQNTLEADSPFIWFFPSFDLLIKRFREVPAFNILVHQAPDFAKKFSWQPGMPCNMSAVDTLPANEWLGYFAEQMAVSPGEKRDREREKPVTAIRQTVEDTYQLERKRLIENLRKASVRDRYERGRGQIVPLLKAYSPYQSLNKVKVPSGVSGVEFSLQVPGVVAGLLLSISSNTEPARDRGLHHAALMMQVAPELLESFGTGVKVETAMILMPQLSQVFKTVESQKDALSGVLTLAEQKIENWVSSRTETLRTLESKFTAKLAKEQLGFGVVGLKNAEGAQILKSVGHGFVITSGEEEPFVITDAKTGMQLSWKLISIERNFAYYPALGSKTAELWALNNAGEPDGSLALTEKLATVLINGQKRILTGNNKAELEMLTFAVTMEVMKRQLDELADLMRQFGELTMDVLEMVPGMQPLIAARLVMSIVAFVASPDFQEIKKTITDNPQKVLGELFDRLSAFVEPAMLWDFILFTDTSVLSRLHGKKVDKKPKLKKGGNAARLLQVINKLFNFGEEVAGDFARYQTWMRWQSERVEMFVLHRPALNTVLHLIALYSDQVVALTSMVAEYLGSDPKHRSDMVDGLKNWPDAVHELVLRVGDIQLPDEVLPMGELVEGLVELIVSRLGAKYKMGANVVLYLLRLIGKEQEVFDFLAAQIPSDLNPNFFWQKKVKEPLTKELDEAGKAFAKAVFDFMAGALKSIDAFSGESGQFAGFSKNVDVEFATRRAKEAESRKSEAQQPYGWNAGTRPIGAPLPTSAGRPLSTSVKQSVEGWFGQDFSHVRLHHDESSSRYTEAVSAAAVTAGSHIFLNPSVDFASSAGQHVLRHELAHVVQQTGQHTLRQPQGSSPVQPLAGGGLSFNRTMEAEAEAAALTPLNPIRSRSRRGGACPITLADISRRFLMHITSGVDLETKQALGDAARAEKIPPSISPKLKGFADSYNEAIKTHLVTPRPFDKVVTDIRNHLDDKATATGSRGKEVKAAFHNAVLDSIRETGKEKQKDGTEKPLYKLDRSRLEVSLSRRILGISGIDMDFTIVEEKGTGPVKIVEIKVKFVHLAVIHAMSPLWQKLSPKVDPDLVPILRGVLFDEGIGLGVWEKTGYSLTHHIIEKAKKLKELGGTPSVQPGQLPRVNDYIETAPSGSGTQIGLRLGTYNDSGGGTQTGPDRESHHTSQFLLVEFFANAATEPAFPLLEKSPDLYPGVKPVSTSSDKVETISGDTTIQINAQFQGRGGIMPCILLSKPAHHVHGLHMTPDIDDLKEQKKSQAGVVKKRFKDALGNYKPLAGDDLPTATFAAKNWNKKEMQTAIYKAVNETYHAVWDGRMKNALKLALAGPERTYYNALADLRPDGNKGERMTPQMALNVWAKAVNHNDTLMTEKGWK